MPNKRKTLSWNNDNWIQWNNQLIKPYWSKMLDKIHYLAYFSAWSKFPWSAKGFRVEKNSWQKTNPIKNIFGYLYVLNSFFYFAIKWSTSPHSLHNPYLLSCIIFQVNDSSFLLLPYEVSIQIHLITATVSNPKNPINLDSKTLFQTWRHTFFSNNQYLLLNVNKKSLTILLWSLCFQTYLTNSFPCWKCQISKV